MLSVVTLASWLVASGVLPVVARLDLTEQSNERLALRLCFRSEQPHQVAYRIEVTSRGSAGTSRSRQSGELTSGPTEQCPISNRLSRAADTRIEATVDWTLDGQPQPPLQQRYPTDPIDEPDEPGSPTA